MSTWVQNTGEGGGLCISEMSGGGSGQEVGRDTTGGKVPIVLVT